MKIAFAPLPFEYDALEPVISAETLQVHHGKHHRGYLERLAAIIRGTELEDETLESIVRRTARGRTTARRLATFNNAAQAWNHQFYWDSLRPRGGEGPTGELAERLSRDFTGPDGFADAFKSAASNVFGSGWAWLVIERGVLRIVTTANADTPIAHGRRPLLVIDAWEHAYYLDYHERRPTYVAGVVDNLLNWDFADRNLHHWLATADRPALSEGAVHA